MTKPLNILILEDEVIIARSLERIVTPFANVKIATIDIVFRRLCVEEASISKATCDLKTLFILKSPYPESQRAEIPYIKFDIWLITLFIKKDIPLTPMMINRVSDIAQKRAT